MLMFLWSIQVDCQQYEDVQLVGTFAVHTWNYSCFCMFVHQHQNTDKQLPDKIRRKELKEKERAESRQMLKVS